LSGTPNKLAQHKGVSHYIHPGEQHVNFANRTNRETSAIQHITPGPILADTYRGDTS